MSDVNNLIDLIDRRLGFGRIFSIQDDDVPSAIPGQDEAHKALNTLHQMMITIAKENQRLRSALEIIANPMNLFDKAEAIGIDLPDCQPVIAMKIIAETILKEQAL